MKFQHFFKVHQISSNLQNLLESSSETCMWNLTPFKEVDLFHRKMPTVPALYNIMKFQHFFKVHQISSNLQNILESSSETCMWNLSQFRKVDLFHRKMPTVPALWNIMKFQHFFKVHQISSNLQNILESSSETCMWNLSQFRKVDLFHRKNADSAGPLKYHEISTFFQSSPNFIKLAEHIWIIIRNMHVKFEKIQRSWLIS